MNLIPWKNKARELDISNNDSMLRFRNEMDRLFERFFTQPWSMSTLEGAEAGAFIPSLDLIEKDDEVLVRIEVPGMEPKDIDINILGDMLTITGTKKAESEERKENTYYAERRFGTFRRGVPLPAAVDVDKIVAEYENGVLNIKLPRSEKARPRHIKVSGGQAPSAKR